MDDTPHQLSYSWDECDFQRDSCPNSPGFDPTENYMNYGRDECQSEFSSGQIARMWAQWNEYRASAQAPVPTPTQPPFQEEPGSPTPSPPACFSERNYVNVEGKGKVPMKDVRVGDMILVAGGKYEPVYSFCKRSVDMIGEYIQVFTSQLEEPLELTGNHLVFIQQGKGHVSVSASRLEAGNVLYHENGPVVVSKIQTVQRSGAYAPYTSSGTIVVNGVLASTYATLPDGILSNDSHELLHFSQTHHRVLCSLFVESCRQETYSDDEGLSPISKVSQDIYNLASTTQYRIVSWLALGIIISGLALLRVLELTNWGIVALLVAVAWRLKHRRQQRGRKQLLG